MVGAEGCKLQIAGLLSQLERAVHHLERRSNGTRPGKDVVADDNVHLPPEAREVSALHQGHAKIAKVEAVVPVAEPWTDHHAQLGEGDGRAVTMAVLQAEIRHAQD